MSVHSLLCYSLCGHYVMQHQSLPILNTVLVVDLGFPGPYLRTILPRLKLGLGRPKSTTRTVFRMAK